MNLFIKKQFNQNQLVQNQLNQKLLNKKPCSQKPCSQKPCSQNVVLMRGFTLIEVITVIVILSLLSVLGSKFVVESTKSYQTTQTRSRLVNTGRQAIERLSRQLRDALPYSVRITNSNTCLEFMPIAGGGNYLSPVPDLQNGVVANAVISVSPHTIDFGAPSYVSIGAMKSDEIYGSPAVSIAALSSRTATQLNLSSAKKWERNSVNQRFYLLTTPSAVCVVNNQLKFYENVDITAAEVNTADASSLLADTVDATSNFSITAASENRNVNVLLNLTFTVNGESVALNHSVMIRNVP